MKWNLQKALSSFFVAFLHVLPLLLSRDVPTVVGSDWDQPLLK